MKLVGIILAIVFSIGSVATVVNVALGLPVFPSKRNRLGDATLYALTASWIAIALRHFKTL